jgi:sporulation protein YlmC with PRC-barrel domain
MNTIVTSTVAAVIVGLLFAPIAFAGQESDSEKEVRSPQTSQQTPVSPMQKGQEAQRPSPPTGLKIQPMPEGSAHLLKASKLVGYSVKNRQGEELGEIEELVINPQDGRIAYAVLSFGGFLGIGDKHFMIPWESLTPMPEQQSFQLEASKEQLAKAPGFDDTNWPNMATREQGTNVQR